MSADNHLLDALRRLLDEAQEQAPSYIHIRPDGAPMTCETCMRATGGRMVRVFTPDKLWHGASHLTCLEPEWVENAKDMGTFPKG